MDAIIAGSRVDTSNPQMQNMLERLARSGGGGQSDSLDQLVKQKELQDGVSGSKFLNYLSRASDDEPDKWLQ